MFLTATIRGKRQSLTIYPLVCHKIFPLHWTGTQFILFKTSLQPGRIPENKDSGGCFPAQWCFRKVKWCLNYAHKTRSFIQRLLLNCQNKLEYIQNTLVSEYTRVTSSNKIFKEHLIHICAKFLLSYVTTFQACNSLPEWVVPVYFKEKTIPLKNSYM